MRSIRLVPLVLAATFAATLATRAGAQVTAPVPAVDAPAAIGYQNIAGVNPIGLIPGLLSAEFEHVIAPGFTVGLGGTHETLIGRHDYDVQSSWLDAKALYYPAENGFAGLGVGVTAGFLTSHGAHGNDKSQPIQHKAGATIGILADYNWFTGRAQRLYFGTGIGAKRVFGPSGKGSILPAVYPYLRAQLGLAF